MGKKRDNVSVIYMIAFCFLLSIVLIVAIFLISKSMAISGKVTDGTLNLVVQSDLILIDSPTNSTYNFEPANNYTLVLNVSSIFSPTSWWYTLYDLTNNVVVNDSIVFTPNSTINAVRNSNNLTVYANHSTEGVFQKSVVFFINTTNLAPEIEFINTSIFICENDFLSYLFNVSDVDETTPIVTMTPLNPFYLRFTKNVNLTANEYEIFSGFLTKSHAGGVDAGSRLYEESVSASDGSNSDLGLTNITVIEVNNGPVFQTIGVRTVYTLGDDSNLYYASQVTDTEDGNQSDGNLTFNISFSGDFLFNVTSEGIINFTANSSHLTGGQTSFVHNVSVCSTDDGILNPHSDIVAQCNQGGGNITTCENFTLTITNQNRYPNITDYYPLNLTSIIPGTTVLYFNVTEYDADGTVPDVYWYVDNIFKEYDSGSLFDEFSYSFGCGVSGEHNVTAVSTDGLLNYSVQWNITVTNVICVAGSIGGGGGGGGGVSVFCEEKWACEEWDTCQNLRDSSSSLEEISKGSVFFIKERCSLFGWSPEICGYQLRECKDLNLCNKTKLKPEVVKECHYTDDPNCFDGITNCHDGSCEVLEDCGGPCDSCQTCSDGIKNQGEEKIDCGGPCEDCEEPLKIPYEIPIYVSIGAFGFSIVIIIILIIKYYIGLGAIGRLLIKKK